MAKHGPLRRIVPQADPPRREGEGGFSPRNDTWSTEQLPARRTITYKIPQERQGKKNFQKTSYESIMCTGL